MIRLRVKEPPQHRCSTCAHGRVAELESGAVETVCSRGMSNTVVRGRVKHCTQYEYEFQYAPSWMTEMAWRVERRGGRAGFTSGRVSIVPPESESKEPATN